MGVSYRLPAPEARGVNLRFRSGGVSGGGDFGGSFGGGLGGGFGSFSFGFHGLLLGFLLGCFLGRLFLLSSSRSFLSCLLLSSFTPLFSLLLLQLFKLLLRLASSLSIQLWLIRTHPLLCCCELFGVFIFLVGHCCILIRLALLGGKDYNGVFGRGVQSCTVLRVVMIVMRS